MLAEVVAALAERGLRLASTQRRFSVEFGAADFASPQANKYEYRLLGESAQWTEVDAEHRIASFSNLWPGKYVLELRARNRVGDASSAPTRVTVTIDPAWWQTGWFVLAMLLLIVALAFLLVRFSADRYRRRALGLQVLVVAGIVWALKARPTTPRGLLKLGGLATPLVALPAYC